MNKRVIASILIVMFFIAFIGVLVGIPRNNTQLTTTSGVTLILCGIASYILKKQQQAEQEQAEKQQQEDKEE